MGRQVRMVPANWEHPKEPNGDYKPLFETFKPFSEMQAKVDTDIELWEKGEHPDQDKDWKNLNPREYSYYEWHGGCYPDEKAYMPYWPPEERTHYQMYESTSEGTPISPPMETPEALAKWLTVNDASYFGSITVTEQQWLDIIKTTLKVYE